MEKETIQELASKFLAGTATEQEKQQLHQWYDGWQDDEEIVVADTDNATEIKNRIFRTIQDKLKEDMLRRPVRKIRAARIMAAASILLLLCAGAWFVFFRNTPDKIPATERIAFKNDIQPGGNKATLTLGDGTVITLDSATDGTIAKQGNATVIKLGSGLLSYQLSGEKHEEEIYNTISTPKGGQYQLELPDGSKVWLNAQSSLRFPASFTGTQRQVELTGEGYFEVVKNTAVPFIVRVNDMRVQVLGTHFNVMAYTDENAIETTLLEGAVRVSNGNTAQVIKPGQQVLVKENAPMEVVSGVNMDETVAWKEGRFSFTETPMPDIIRQLSRWYDIEPVFTGTIPDVFIANISRNEPISKILHLLESAGGVHFAIEGKKVIVSPAK